jgi:hypothetical protein
MEPRQQRGLLRDRGRRILQLIEPAQLHRRKCPQRHLCLPRPRSAGATAPP